MVVLHTGYWPDWSIKSRCYRVRTGHGKPGKPWNLRILFSRPGKSWNFIVGPWKSWKIKVLFGSFVTADDKLSRDNVRWRGEIKQRKRHAFWWTTDFVSVELLVVKKYPQIMEIFWKFLIVTTNPKVVQNFKRSWKMSWKVKRAQKSTNPVLLVVNKAR